MYKINLICIWLISTSFGHYVFLQPFCHVSENEEVIQILIRVTSQRRKNSNNSSNSSFQVLVTSVKYLTRSFSLKS